MALCSCFGSSKAQREADRLESEDARAKAAEAARISRFLGDFDVQLMGALANCRQEKFEKSAAGRAVRAQIAAAKQSNSPSKGEPVLKVIVCLWVTWV
ncbi:hypothetical protein MA16_Dca026602 [Dendrobium catenatum]|uniref:Uncharacterized protein n=1 Tax=Dendrobium catenatum TaxID=906689 RepID=A0A2I0WZL2_9ASPA|nr:hypothetical protein MA16_Dca026602 [Dendrobium catenatum]